MTDELLDRFRGLNPVPDPDRLVALGEPDLPADPALRGLLEQARAANNHPKGEATAALDGLTDKEIVMSVVTPPRTEKPPRPRSSRPRRRLVAALGGVAILLAGAVLYLTAPARDGNVIGQPEDPESLAVAAAETYLTARNDNNPEAAREVLADDVVFQAEAFRELDDLEMAFEALSRYGFRLEPSECTTRELPGRFRVVCDYTLESRLQTIVDHPPVSGGQFRFEVADGRITSVLDLFPVDEFSPNVFEPFVTWLSPRNFPVLFREVDGGAMMRLEPAAVEQIPEFLDRYEAFVESQASDESAD